MSIFASDQVGHNEEAEAPDGDRDTLENSVDTKHRQAKQTETHQYLRPVVLCSHIYPTRKQAHWDSPSAKEVGTKTQP